MLIKINSVAFEGLEVLKVVVEINIHNRGLPSFDIVGLPNKSIEESKHRIKAAIQNSGFEFPNKKITVNLAPADVHKEGSFYDLPIAIGLICLENNLCIQEKSIFFGELSLDGSLRLTKGVLLVAIFAKESGLVNVFIPDACVNEAIVIQDIKVIGVKNLFQLFEFIKHGKVTASETEIQQTFDESMSKAKNEVCSFNEIYGQLEVKRALEISAAGNHNILLIGPPGSGKSMLARSLVSLLPPLTEYESIEVTKIYSITGRLNPLQPLILQRPYRSPHHTISYAGLIGGGQSPHPGEISLAHRGILFLDEFNEFSRTAIEALRQPLEEGLISITRSRGNVIFPARFMLVAASNPCPCGYLGHPKKECTCISSRLERYKQKLSGPLIDRIDLRIRVQPLSELKFHEYLGVKKVKYDVAQVKERVFIARSIQLKRFKECSIFSNSEMNNNQIKRFCAISHKSDELLQKALESFNLTARGYFKVIKVAQTIVDLEGAPCIKEEHLMESLHFRNNN